MTRIRTEQPLNMLKSLNRQSLHQGKIIDKKSKLLSGGKNIQKSVSQNVLNINEVNLNEQIG